MNTPIACNAQPKVYVRAYMGVSSHVEMDIKIFT